MHYWKLWEELLQRDEADEQTYLEIKKTELHIANLESQLNPETHQ